MNRVLHAALAVTMAGALLLSGLPAAGSVPDSVPGGSDTAGKATFASASALAPAPVPDPDPAFVPQSIASPNATFATPVYDEPNTTNYLAPPPSEVAVSDVVTPRLDVGAAVAVGSVRLAVRFRVGNVLAAHRSARNASARRAVVYTYFQRIENATTLLERREQAALSAHNAGELSTAGFVRELASIDAAAERLLTTLGQVERLSDQSSPSYPVSRERLGMVRVRLRLLQGPVRERARAVLNGSHPPIRVHVETASRAVVLATVIREDGQPTYLREAYLPGERDPGDIDRYQGNPVEVLNRVTQLYPWLGANNEGPDFHFGPGPAHSLTDAGVYQITFPHLHGRMTVLLDGGSDQVFYEIQRKNLRSIPLGQSATNSSEGLRITVHRTRPSGPVRVVVSENGSDGFVPVDAAVRIGKTPVGTTGDDGVLWTVAPRGAVRVTASHGSRNVTVTRFSVSPVEDNATARTALSAPDAASRIRGPAVALRPVPS